MNFYIKFSHSTLFGVDCAKCFKRSVLKYVSLKLLCNMHQMVENNGIEPMTSCVQSRRSPS